MAPVNSQSITPYVVRRHDYIVTSDAFPYLVRKARVFCFFFFFVAPVFVVKPAWCGLA